MINNTFAAYAFSAAGFIGTVTPLFIYFNAACFHTLPHTVYILKYFISKDFKF